MSITINNNQIKNRADTEIKQFEAFTSQLKEAIADGSLSHFLRWNTVDMHELTEGEAFAKQVLRQLENCTGDLQPTLITQITGNLIQSTRSSEAQGNVSSRLQERARTAVYSQWIQFLNPAC